MDLSHWSVVVLPDEVVGRGGILIHFAAFFISTTPVYLQLWRPADDQSGAQLVLAYNQKVYPRAVNQIETVSMRAFNSKTVSVIFLVMIFYQSVAVMTT